jgi:hypothetical protein
MMTEVAANRTGHGGLIIKVGLTKKNLIENEINRDTRPSKPLTIRESSAYDAEMSGVPDEGTSPDGPSMA